MPTAAARAAPPPAPPRRRVYAAVDPRCDWASTEHADTLIVDVSGFRKEELKVLYRTNRKLTVTGERQVDGVQWSRFRKVFPVPRSCDTGAIRAKMDLEGARLSVILPKRSSSSAPPKDKHEEHQSVGDEKGPGSAQEDAGKTSSGSSTGSLYSAQEDIEEDKVEEKEQRGEHGDANAAKGDDKNANDEGNRWWRKIRVLHVLGFVLILALVGVGATVLYIMLL